MQTRRTLTLSNDISSLNNLKRLTSNMLRGLDSLSSFTSRINNLILARSPNVGLADTRPCKYTTLYSKTLLVFFPNSDNTILNLYLYTYISDFDQIISIFQACYNDI